MLGRLLVLAVSGLLLGGYAGEDDEPAGAAAAAPTTTTVVSWSGRPSTAPVVVQSSSSKVALLTAVRAASHPGFDRIVFQFRNVVPGYTVRYVRPPVHADGSGAPVSVKGLAILLVRMEPALDADLSKTSAPRTYHGPNRIRPSTTAVRELVRIGGFESVLSWAVGLDSRRPFRVSALKRPPRIVIDVATR